MSTRNPERTRRQILDAAFEEFSAHGLAGARVDRIAERAQVNKRMLYHYFGGKEELFRALLLEKLREQVDLRRETPAGLAEALVLFQRDQARHPAWARLNMWEALAYGADDIVNESERTEAWQAAVDGVRAGQAAGALPAGLDAAQLQLSLVALVTFPIAFPQFTRMITGREPDDPAFLAERTVFLERLAGLLGGRPITT